MNVNSCANPASASPDQHRRRQQRPQRGALHRHEPVDEHGPDTNSTNDPIGVASVSSDRAIPWTSATSGASSSSQRAIDPTSSDASGSATTSERDEQPAQPSARSRSRAARRGRSW